MIELNWIFCNGHKWKKEFSSIEEAEKQAYLLDLINGSHIDRVWIDTDTEQIWLREKN